MPNKSEWDINYKAERMLSELTQERIKYGNFLEHYFKKPIYEITTIIIMEERCSFKQRAELLIAKERYESAFRACYELQRLFTEVYK